MPAIRIGINPISWSNDDLPSLGGETPLSTALSEGKQIGYEGFELNGKFPKDAKGVGDVLRPYDLALVSGWYSSRLARRSAAQEIDAIASHVQLLAENGAKVLVYGEVADSIQGQRIPLIERPRFHTEQAWQAYADKLNELAQFTLSQGVRLAYHHHMGAYIESPSDIDTLMSLTNRDVGLLFDAGHCYMGGGEPIEVLRKHIDRVCHVHFKDVRKAVVQLARNNLWSFPDCIINGTFTVPGDGDIDFASLLDVLMAANYQGWLVVEAEQDPAVAPSIAYAQKGYQTLRGLLDARDGPMSLLIKRQTAGQTLVQLPEGALEYVGFSAYQLAAGERLPVSAGDHELCLVLLGGRVTVTGEEPGQGAFSWENIGDRHSVFEDKSPFAVYLPPGSQAQVLALSEVQIAVCSAPGSASAGLGARLIKPEAMKRSVRGKGANTRYVCDILPDTEPAHSLLVVEVRTPSGHSSSYPPHKHDTDDLPHQSFLEETYYHQINPPQGFVFQRVYTDDRSLDQAMAVENSDLVVVPKGYHPVSVPYGYESYYLNVMAGPKRVWQFHNDPQHSWLMDL